MMDIIFDMDMTLCNSRPALRFALEQYFAGYGVSVDYQGFSGFMGRNEKYFIQYICDMNGLRYSDEMKERIFDIYDEAAPGLVTAYAGAAQTIRALKAQGRKVAVASSADRRKVLTNISCIGLSEADFDAVVAGDEVTEAKPSPEVFLFAAGKMRALIKDCVVMEDSKNGIIAAKAAGAKVIAFTSVHSREELLSWGADATVDMLADILHRLKVM